MKKETRQTRQAAEQTIETVNSTIELSQKTANVILDGAVKTAGLADAYMRNLIQVGLDTQEASVNVARSYYEGMAQINRGWLDLFAATSEKTISSIGEVVKKPINDVVAVGAEVVENASAQAKQSAK